MTYIEIRMTKTILYLYEHELVRLLAKDPALWRLAIGRGKGIKRGEATARRQAVVKRLDDG